MIVQSLDANIREMTKPPLMNTIVTVPPRSANSKRKRSNCLIVSASLTKRSSKLLQPMVTSTCLMMTSSLAESDALDRGSTFVTMVLFTVDISCSNFASNCAPGKATDIHVRWNSALVTS